MAGKEIQELKDWWKHQKSLERMNESMRLWDKKLSKLNDEMLYYILMRATSIVEFREKKNGQV